ncbi:MAG: DNA repair protein RadA [Candidatus Brocadiales bacterium]
MVKSSVSYVCQACGWRSKKWLGRCGGCGEWDSLIEEYEPSESAPKHVTLPGEEPRPLSEIGLTEEARTITGIEEFDRVLGGGVVKGSAVLIGGPPGIGKSTLLLQVCHSMGQKGQTPLYITGEESLVQVRLRADRLGIDSGEKILLGVETSLENILGHIETLKPTLTVIDSIQMISKAGLPSAPGTLSQVSQCANELVFAAKAGGSAVFIVGHVTKQGMLAGPRVLEHMADTVLYFEGEKARPFRILRAVKNRFGPTDEVAIFEMRAEGLGRVDDLSRLFLSSNNTVTSGTAVISAMEGTRALLLEVQALVTRTNFGTPERRVSGVDRNRVSMLIAVLEKRLGLHLGNQDVFVNAVGGVRVDEPAADMGIAMSIASSFKEKPIPSGVVLLGEVGLAGEVRAISYVGTRLREAARHGFKRAIIPIDGSGELGDIGDIELIKVSNLTGAVKRLWG